VLTDRDEVAVGDDDGLYVAVSEVEVDEEREGERDGDLVGLPLSETDDVGDRVGEREGVLVADMDRVPDASCCVGVTLAVFDRETEDVFVEVGVTVDDVDSDAVDVHDVEYVSLRLQVGEADTEDVREEVMVIEGDSVHDGVTVGVTVVVGLTEYTKAGYTEGSTAGTITSTRITNRKMSLDGVVGAATP
jgi:hypothetical protein